MTEPGADRFYGAVLLGGKATSLPVPVALDGSGEPQRQSAQDVVAAKARQDADEGIVKAPRPDANGNTTSHRDQKEDNGEYTHFVFLTCDRANGFQRSTINEARSGVKLTGRVILWRRLYNPLY